MSDFENNADALEAACADLMGIDLEGLSFSGTPAGPSGEIITLADCQEVTDAIAAVEMRASVPCSFSTLLTNPAPDVCAAGSGPNIIFYDDFESGLGSWTVTQHPVNPGDWDPREWIIEGSLPASRTGSAAYGPDPIPVGNCSTDFDNGIIRMQSPLITIPAAVATPVEMRFTHYVATETSWDGANIKYSLNGGAWTLLPNAAFTFNGYNGTLNTAGAGNDNPMAGEAAFHGADEGSVISSWGESVIDLDGLGLAANDDIRIRFEVGVDGCNGNDGWYVDDVLIYNCVVGLPVEFVSFTAKAKGDNAILEWITASEINSLKFDIERSLDGTSGWRKIGEVAAAGNSSEQIEYHFRDEEPSYGKNYYRLKQWDKDGSFTYSDIESVIFRRGMYAGISIQPNPFSSSFSLAVPTLGNEEIQIEVFDASGKIILQKNKNVINGESVLMHEMDNLPQGVFWLRVNTMLGTYTEKIIKVLD